MVGYPEFIVALLPEYAVSKGIVYTIVGFPSASAFFGTFLTSVLAFPELVAIALTLLAKCVILPFI